MADQEGPELDQMVKVRREMFKNEICVGCDQRAVAFITIGHYQLWTCELHARQIQKTLNFIVPKAEEE